MQSKNSCDVVQCRGTTKTAAKKKVRGSNTLSGELSELSQVLERATAGEEQPSIRHKMCLDLYFRVFYSSDTDNEFSTRQGLNSLLSLARMRIDKRGLWQKIAHSRGSLDGFCRGSQWVWACLMQRE